MSSRHAANVVRARPYISRTVQNTEIALKVKGQGQKFVSPTFRFIFAHISYQIIPISDQVSVSFCADIQR